MRALVWLGKTNLELRDLANRLTLAVPAKDWAAEIAVIFNWVRERDNVRYTLDTFDIEVLQRADVTLALGYGDCDDMAILLATLLELAGHKCCFCALGFGAIGEYSHVIVICSGAGESDWIALDPTEQNPPGWFPPGVTCKMVAELS